MLVWPVFSPGAGSPSGRFQQGFDAYASEHFQEAANYWREAIQVQPSAGLWHNLGNAEWRCGRTGEAMVAWERANWLDPFNPNTRANLRFGRKTAQLESPALAWYEICSTWLPVNTWAWLASLSFWWALSLVCVPGILRWRRSDWHQGLAAAGFALFLLTLPALLGVQTRSRFGVVLAKDTALRLTPTQHAQTLTRLPAGEMARLEKERGQYVFIRAGNEAAGWVERTQFGLICRP